MEKCLLKNYARSSLKAEMKKKEMYEICIADLNKLSSIDALVNKVFISRGTFFNYFSSIDNFMIQLYKYIIIKEFTHNKTIDLEEIVKNYAHVGFISHLIEYFLNRNKIVFSLLELEVFSNNSITEKEAAYLTKIINDKKLFVSVLYKILI